ncbi:MAG TPA: dephospho-CoA kinase [Bryobacteraceae bacterium]|nr:dephospho-CoA kinase [Bryobacteraceae bacterium]
MLRVGLTGGLASGKSFVAGILGELGCRIVRADEIGRQVEEPGGEAYDGIVAEFGKEILAPDGFIDRRKLAAQVFRDPERLKKLNALVHPPVRARIHKIEDEFAQAHPDGICVTEAAILVETGSYREYDHLIVAVCRPEQQIERAISRDRMTRAEALERISRQMPLREKLKYAAYVIDTSGAKEETAAQTRAVYESLRSLP